jgi:hypothetical protein
MEGRPMITTLHHKLGFGDSKFKTLMILLLLMGSAVASPLIGQDRTMFRYLRKVIRNDRGIRPKQGLVPGESNAIGIAKLVFAVAMPGTSLQDRHFSAQEEAGTWLVLGVRNDAKAGELICEIRKKDGAVLYVGFTE